MIILYRLVSHTWQVSLRYYSLEIELSVVVTAFSSDDIKDLRPLDSFLLSKA
jgi:hypothetical protein